MYTEEDFKNELDKHLPKYFKQNFEGKDLPEAVYQTLRKEMLILSQSYTTLGMFKIILVAIKEQENASLDPKLSAMLDDYIHAVSVIAKKILDIIEPIAEGLNVTIS